MFSILVTFSLSTQQPGAVSGTLNEDFDEGDESSLRESQQETPSKAVESFVTPVKQTRTTPKRRSLPMSPAVTPSDRFKPGWLDEHEKHCTLIKTCTSVLLVGDSIINGLARYPRVWEKYFAPLKALNFGLGGDRTQHVLWRLQNGALEGTPKVVVVHCGTNNIDKNYASEISEGILTIVDFIRGKVPLASVVVVGLLPRDLFPSERREKISEVNNAVAEQLCFSDEFKEERVFFLRPDKDWVRRSGKLDTALYFNDHLHLIEAGDEKLAKFIARLVQELLDAEAVPDEAARTAAKAAIKVLALSLPSSISTFSQTSKEKMCKWCSEN